MNLRPVVFLFLAAATAFGQEPPRARTVAPPPDIAVTVQLSPVGDLAGPWQTFVVELDNKTRRELDLTIHIEDESYLAVATRRERLSSAARKRLFLYSVGSMYTRSLTPRYRITDASNRELASGVVPINQRGSSNNPYQIGLFSRTSAAADDFGIPNGLNGQELRFGRLGTDTFPDRWIGLSALDVLVVHDVAFDELTPDQGRALAEYVRMGGTLVLGPGVTKGWLAHPVLAAFVSVRAGEPQLVKDLPQLTGVHGKFRNNAEPFLAHPLQNGEPFRDGRFGREIVEYSAGFGRVVVLGFDILRAPLDTWSGRRALWSDLIGSSPRWFAEDRGTFPVAGSTQQRLDLFSQMARLINPYPSFALVFGLAAIFLFVVGPLNYVMLWKLRRTLLLVVTIPSISIGFVALILGLGYLLKGTTTVVHSARLLSTRQGLDCAKEIHLFSLFSPSTRSYDVSCEPGTFGQPPGRFAMNDYRYSGRRFDLMSTLTCETGAGLTIRGLNAGQWQSWDLEARALRELGKGVRFEVEGPVVRVSNSSPRHIERAVYVQIDREPLVVPIGEIEPGKTGEGRLEPRRMSALEALGLEPDSLGERMLRTWFDTTLRRARPYENVEQKPQKFLICVLRNDPDPVRVDARVSDRSRSITLLHVGETP
jgi:hypothetical protein